MTRASIRSLLALLLVLTLTPLPMAADSAIGLAVSDGEFQVNHTAVNGSATLFDGAIVQTGEAASRIDLNGASMVLGANSRAKVEGKRIVLEQGLAALHQGSGYRFEARTLRIAPATEKAAAQVQLDGGNRVLVAAVNGPVRVYSGSGLLVASVVPGNNLSFEPQAGAAADGFDRTGCLLFKDGHFALVDSNGQVSEVQSKDFVRSLVEGTGNTVHIVGTIVKVEPVEGTARVVLVTKVPARTNPGGCDAAVAGLPGWQTSVTQEWRDIFNRAAANPPPAAAKGAAAGTVAGIAVGGVSAGAIAGIVIGGAAAVGVVAYVATRPESK